MTRVAGESTATAERPAFYAIGDGSGGVRDWVTLLHPPYTAWHLSYVAIGAALSPRFALWRLGGTLIAFFLAVGVGAHALDELHGRPLRTGISPRLLAVVASMSVAVPVIAGLVYGGSHLIPFVIVGAILVVGYNLELWRGALHNDIGFALAWGAFPVLTGCYAQHFQLSAAAVLAALAAVLLSLGQRSLSLRVRALRRRTSYVQGRVVSDDGDVTMLDRTMLLAPLEGALRFVACGLVVLAAALVLSR